MRNIDERLKTRRNRNYDLVKQKTKQYLRAVLKKPINPWWRRQLLIRFFFENCGRYNDEPRLFEASKTLIRPLTWTNYQEAASEAKISSVVTAFKIVRQYISNRHRLRHPHDFEHPDIKKQGPRVKPIEKIRSYLEE